MGVLPKSFNNLFSEHLYVDEAVAVAVPRVPLILTPHPLATNCRLAGDRERRRHHPPRRPRRRQTFLFLRHIAQKRAAPSSEPPKTIIEKHLEKRSGIRPAL